MWIKLINGESLMEVGLHTLLSKVTEIKYDNRGVGFTHARTGTRDRAVTRTVL